MEGTANNYNQRNVYFRPGADIFYRDASTCSRHIGKIDAVGKIEATRRDVGFRPLFLNPFQISLTIDHTT